MSSESQTQPGITTAIGADSPKQNESTSGRPSSQTHPGITTTIGIDPLELAMLQPMIHTSQTVIVSFDKIAHLLSDKELRRPRTPGPSGDELKRIAKKHQPPAEWFEGEEDCPF